MRDARWIALDGENTDVRRLVASAPLALHRQSSSFHPAHMRAEMRAFAAFAGVRTQKPMHDTPDQVHWHEPKAGQNAGLIDNVTVTGQVNGRPGGASVAGVIAGGLIGQNGYFGSNQAAGTISGSNATVSVTLGDGCAFDCNGAQVEGDLTVSVDYRHGTSTGISWAL